MDRVFPEIRNHVTPWYIKPVLWFVKEEAYGDLDPMNGKLTIVYMKRLLGVTYVTATRQTETR